MTIATPLPSGAANMSRSIRDVTVAEADRFVCPANSSYAGVQQATEECIRHQLPELVPYLETLPKGESGYWNPRTVWEAYRHYLEDQAAE